MAESLIKLPAEPDPSGEQLQSFTATRGGEEVNAETAVLVDTNLDPYTALTDAELRATPVDVAGPLTDAELRAADVNVYVNDGNMFIYDGGGSITVDDGSLSLTVDGPLTDAELRAAPLDVSVVSGTVPVTDNGGSLTVDGPLTNTELRAVAVPVSVSGTVAVIDNSGSLTVDDGGGSLTVDGTVAVSGTVPVSGTFYPATQPVSGTVTVANPTTNPETGLAKDGTDITSPTAMPAGGAGIRGWLSAIWTKLNGTLAVSGTFWQATQPVSGTVAVSNATFPATDNGGSLTVDSPQLPAALGQTTKAASLPVALASNQDALPVTDNGGSLTVDGTVAVTGTFWQATQPVSGTVTVNALPAGTANIGDVDVLTLPALPAGSNNIGDVDVLTLPALPAGTNNIGDVDVLTLPALPTGANTIGAVTQASGPWSTNVTQLQSATPSASNPLPVRITDGTTYQGAKRTYRLTARALSVAMGGTNATKTVLAIWHASASAIRLELQRVVLTFTSTAAGVVNAELVRITSAPTGGSSVAANVVPNDAGDAATAQSAMTLPTAEPSKTAPLTSVGVNVGAVAATTDVSHITPIVLYTHDDQERKPLAARASQLEGYGIQLFSTTNVTYIVTVEVEFTEVG